MTQKTALIAWGGWEGHTPERSANIVREILEKHGFQVTVSMERQPMPTRLKDLSLIVPMITMSEIAKEELENLTAAVRSGVGMAGFHGTMCDSFRKETEYQFMTGGQWVSHPGNIIDYRIKITCQDDPIMAGISRFRLSFRTIFYACMIRRTKSWRRPRLRGEHLDFIKGVVMPVVWKKKYGKAGCSIRHSAIRPTSSTCRR